MKIYVTKYALTAGIKECEGTVDGNTATVKNESWGYTYFHKGEWHMASDSAAKKAEEMRLAKIASLRKQIAKLEATKF